MPPSTPHVRQRVILFAIDDFLPLVDGDILLFLKPLADPFHENMPFLFADRHCCQASQQLESCRDCSAGIPVRSTRGQRLVAQTLLCVEHCFYPPAQRVIIPRAHLFAALFFYFFYLVSMAGSRLFLRVVSLSGCPARDTRRRRTRKIFHYPC